MPSCIICNKEGAQVCQGCHSASYCSRQCQFKDYRTHRVLCSRMKEHQDRPSENMRRGIMFPQSGVSPRRVWIQTESKDGCPSLVVDDHLMTSSHNPMKVLSLLIQHNQSRRRALHDTLAISYCDKEDLGDSYPNRSIQWVAKGATASPWYGPIIVTKKLGFEADLAAYSDMDGRDYRDAIDTLIYDYNPGVSTVSMDGSSIQPLYSARTVQGVRVSCSGDINVLIDEACQKKKQKCNFPPHTYLFFPHHDPSP